MTEEINKDKQQQTNIGESKQKVTVPRPSGDEWTEIKKSLDMSDINSLLDQSGTAKELKK
jgi:hypothetical protein